jgi:hypothetical protein
VTSSTRFSWALLSCGAWLVSCTRGPVLHAASFNSEAGCGPPSEEMKPLASLGQDPAPFTLAHRPSDGDPSAKGELLRYSYRFERETSGTTDTLRAVSMVHWRPPIVVGDRGTVLVRDPKSGWAREATGTEEDLYALAPAPVHRSGSSEEQTAPAPYVAVGAHGTALVRDPAGVWHVEKTGVSADLHGLWNRGRSTVAVGARGTMVERSPEGVWREIQTRTQADLYAMGPCSTHACAVGAAGTIVDCAAQGDDLVCVPRRPVTDGALFVVTDSGLLLGKGAWLRPVPAKDREGNPPPEWEHWRDAGESVRENEARAAANNPYLGVSEMLVAGRGGAVWLVGYWGSVKTPVLRIEAPFGVDFHGVANEVVDGFLVGEKGTIVKVGVGGFVPLRICYA